MKVTVGLIQMTSLEDPAKNLQKAIAKIRRAANRGARVICLQELFRTRYFCQSRNRRFFDLAESISGPTIKVLSMIAREKKVVLIAPLFEQSPNGAYHNSAVVMDADGVPMGIYRKTHIPDEPRYYEKFYFKPGNLGFPVFKTRYGRFGVLICWDQWFPEAARIAALKGAEILFYPAAIGWYQAEPRQLAESELQKWEIVQRGHAVANALYVASVNRVGREGQLVFWGNSFVADPSGNVIARATRNKEQILLAECDLSQLKKVRQAWPFFRDRRPGIYQTLTGKR
ncbi:MAG: carbon-nitrogen hydrolase [Candidatus Omnitrophica bacterium]|nr:carbon-nitrogen hydrolase [Candidatus Omnitrophota bacterium]MDD5671668.1 carbon-nitrogen hydrolase [Candidatus Omnitrophota bacterium]